MLHEINDIYNELIGRDTFRVLMGGYIENWSYHDMVPIWLISYKHVTQMYRDNLEHREKYKLL